MKYNFTAKFVGLGFGMFLKSYYKKNFKDLNFKPIYKDVKKEYKDMVLRTPGIGGKKNFLEPNLLMACYFFAIAKKVPDMTLERLNEIVDMGMSSKIIKKFKALKKGKMFKEKVMNKRAQDAINSQTSPYEMDWQFTFTKGKDEYYYNYTKCGICTLAKKEHMEKWVPCLCRTDFQSFKLEGANLIRTKTLGNGDDCCDFHVIRDK